MKNIIAGVLIVLAIGLGYMGINKLSSSSESVEILGLELTASDNDEKTTAYVYLGLAVISLVGGVVIGTKK